MKKTNYSVARVQTYTRASIVKAERHNERKNTTYSNMNVDLGQTQNNVHYKKCDGTYNERLKEMIDTGDVSLRGLKDNAKIFDEIIFDINSDYFEQNGGYEFAKEFYEKAFHFAEQEMGAKNIISAVMHADELNTALTEEYGKPIYHYHLHVIAIPVVRKEIKWFKRCKDKSLFKEEEQEKLRKLELVEQQRLEKLYTLAEREILANITDYDKAYLNRFEGEIRERVERGLIDEYEKKMKYQEKVSSPEYKNKRRSDKNAR